MGTSGMDKLMIPRAAIYSTWYDFKKELERRLGHSVLNLDWLEVKPRAPLPWNNANMRTTLSTLARLENEKIYPQEHGRRN